MRYVLTLKNEKVRTYRIIRELLASLNLVGLVILYIISPKDFRNLLFPVFAAVVSAIYLFFAVIERIRDKPSADNWYLMVFYIGALAWLKSSSAWWIGIILLAFTVLDLLAHRKLKVIFNNMYLKLPILFSTRIEWNQLSNVMLKDGMLTIDFRNNRLFQHPVVDSDWEIDENEFNSFCQQQIARAPLRV